MVVYMAVLFLHKPPICVGSVDGYVDGVGGVGGGVGGGVVVVVNIGVDGYGDCGGDTRHAIGVYELGCV